MDLHDIGVVGMAVMGSNLALIMDLRSASITIHRI